MTPTSWQRVGELFHKALELPEAARDTWLAEACGTDAELLQQVQALLESDRRAEGLVEEKVQGSIAQFADEEIKTRAPKRAGPYRLVREIGQGGMGTVYLGQRDDDEYKIDVAVKVVTPGMDTQVVLQRFRRERQTLASLEHPNIARLLDGGTTDDGLPYIVMEYIDGVRITDYCRERGVGVEQKLQLFLDVCSAVDHAHRNFIIHRDIKPGNILVTAAGVPKLLDFGISKMDPSGGHESTTERTITTARMMTPDYASPEQVRGDSITVATDVYSLGTVLYELLTGEKAHRFADLSMTEMERVVCFEDVARPSSVVKDRSLGRRLTGDIDTILLRALAKDPARRYLTPLQFAEDIQRHLNNIPVHARPDTLIYRTGKFLKRRRGTVAAVAAVQVALLGGALVAMNQARIANKRLQDVRELANTVVFDIHDRVSALPGSTKAREFIIQTGLRYLDAAAADARGDLGFQVELARGYLRIGELQGGVMNSNLGNTDAALGSYQKAHALLESALKQDAQDLPAAIEWASLALAEGNHYFGLRDRRKALAAFQEGVRVGDPMLRNHPTENNLRLTMAEIHAGMALVYRGDQQAEASAKEGLQATEILNAMPESGRNDDFRYLLAGTLSTLGTSEISTNRFVAGMKHLRTAIDTLEELLRSHPENVNYQHQEMLVWAHISDGYVDHGNSRDAIEAARHFVSIARILNQADQADQRAAEDLGIALTKLAELLPESNPEDRIALLRESVPLLEGVAAKNAKDVQARTYLAWAHQRIGDALSRKKDATGAQAAWRKANLISEPLIATGQRNATITFLNTLGRLGVAAAQRGEPASAESYIRKISETEEPSGRLGKVRAAEVQRTVAATAQQARGNIYASLRTYDKARRELTQSAETWRKLANDSPSAIAKQHITEIEVQLKQMRSPLTP